MKSFTFLIASSFLLAASASHAGVIKEKRTPFAGVDISGVYACVGNDVHDGDFTSTMTVSLDEKFSSGKSGAFQMKMEVGPVTYIGSIVSNGKQLAVDFANTDVSKKDYGVALATLSSPAKGKFKIEKFYYQPEYENGSNGFESCISK